MPSLTERIQLLERAIAYRQQLLENKTEEFNYHEKERDRLQFTCERLATENMKDKASLEELKRIKNENPVLARQ